MTPFEIIGIVLLIAGFVLVGIEMAVPGFGLPGISGIISLVLGIITWTNVHMALLSVYLSHPQKPKLPDRPSSLGLLIGHCTYLTGPIFLRLPNHSVPWNSHQTPFSEIIL